MKVEITRSFSFKKSLGNYEMADFFCSQKAEVPEEEAEKTSEALYNFCRSEVIKSVNSYLQENKPKPVKETKEGKKKIEEFNKTIRHSDDWKERKQNEELLTKQ